MSQIDLVFCCDCTASMSPYIRSAQQNIVAISEKLLKLAPQDTSLRFGLIKYRDHPPQDTTFVTEAFPFTDSIEKMKRNVDTMRAQGGGDGPEAVSAALNEVRQMEWRPNASKVCILIADAPPHGLGESGDGFPKGCPLGIDPLKCCRAMATMGITIYAVGVEPVLSTSYKFARDFMMAIARITDGKFLPLGRAEVLAEVIVQSTLEGANMDALWARLEAATAAEAAQKGESLTEDVLVQRVTDRLATEAAKERVAQVELDNPYMDENYSFSNCDKFERCESLGSACEKLNENANKHVAAQAQQYNWGKQEMCCAPAPAPVTQCQQERMQHHAMKKRGWFSFGSS